MLPFKPVNAQLVFEDWVSTRGMQDLFVTGKSVSDPSGNVYQAGATLNPAGNYDALVSKYDPKGVLLWSETFDGPDSGDDLFVDIAYYGSIVYTTGVARNASATASKVLTVQLSAIDGTSDWEEYYNYSGTIYNLGASLTVDGPGNVYVAGVTSSLSSFTDALVLKYDENGVLKWVHKEDVSNGGEDGAVKIEYNGGKISVIGGTKLQGGKWQYLALSYNTLGSLVDTYTGNSNSTAFKKVADMVLDDQGNIYITGCTETLSQGYNMYTVKLDDELNVLWNRSFNYAGSGDDKAYGICMDNSDNVIITGYTGLSGGNTQFTTVKYSNGGTLLWNEGYDVSTASDTAKVVTADSDGNIYVAGTFYNGSNQDIKTVKYDPSGNRVWQIDYNGVYNGDDYLLDMTFNGNDIIMMSQTATSSGFEYDAIKYTQIDYRTPEYPNATNPNPNAFVRNLGQLIDEDENPVPSVKYLSKQGSYAGFYKDDAFQLMTRSFHNDTTVNDTAQKVSLSFNNPKTGVKVRAFDRSAYFENYYFPYSPNKLERVPFYGKLFYNEVWQGISLETCMKGGQEYSFTVTSKGDPENISLTVAGADSIVKTVGGELLLYTFHGAIRLPHPRVYQKNSSGNLVELGWSPAYSLTDSILTLDSIGSYTSNKDLILRISRDLDDVPETDGFCHSTYFGGASNDLTYNGIVDKDGNPYSCGITSNPNFYNSGVGQQIVLGTYQGNAHGAYISKFNHDMVPYYMSVFSDNVQSIFYTLAFDEVNNVIYAAGETYSNDFWVINDVAADYYDPTYNSGGDGIIARFESGSRQLGWSTYFGSNDYPGIAGGDLIKDIAVDNLGRLYIVGSTIAFSGSDFPYTPLSGAYYDINNSGFTGYIARFTSTLDLDWCTQFSGSSSQDLLAAIDIGANNKIAVAGVTSENTNFLPTFPGTVQNLTRQGDNDWFLGVFDQNGVLEWGTLEGSAGKDFLNFSKTSCDIKFKQNSALFFTANLYSTSGVNFVYSSGGYFNNTNSGASNASQGLNYAMLTYYRSGTYVPLWRTLLMDGVTLNRVNSLTLKDNVLYVAGNTLDATMSLMSISPDLYSEGHTLSGDDGYLMLFDASSFYIKHSTYFGGDQNDAIIAVAANDQDEVFVFGNTNSAYYDTEIGIPVQDNQVSGSWYQENLSNNDNYSYLQQDDFIFKWCLSGTPLNIEMAASPQNANDIEIYPNPLPPNLKSIRLKSDIGRSGLMSIYTSDGRLIKENIRFDGNSLLHLPDLASGMYLLSFEYGQRKVSKKLVIL